MNFPLVLVPELTQRQLERYTHHIDSDASGWHRRWTESIWRRHQHPSNARLSGWRGPEDQKRRLIHFYDEYGLEAGAFVLRHAYLWLNLTLPREDIDEYQETIARGLRHGKWRQAGRDGDDAIWRRGDLAVRAARRAIHPEDLQRGRPTPRSYANLEVSVRTEGYRLPDGWAARPWKVFFDVGLRHTLERGDPRRAAPEAIVDYLPAQVELGCGPSIEAGIPELSTLHRIYGVSRPDYSFVFRAPEDGLLRLFAEPEAKYLEMAALYRACMLAESTPFYRTLRDLWHRGLLVGPVITNNFDCQCADLGLPEISLRRYDALPYYPTIEYDPRARSLLVVGVHADRRLVQMRARARGLKVVFLDPETYVSPDGRAISYPVEAPQSEDLFVGLTAQEGMMRLQRALAAAA